jgi:hypothetical protein
MTPEEREKAIQEILTEHDHAIGAIRQANEAMKEANDAMRRAIERHDEAIVSALLANRVAIQLLHRW